MSGEIVQAEMLEIVAGVGDDDQLVGRDELAEAEHELCAADAAGKRENQIPFVRRAAHRNKSSCGLAHQSRRRQSEIGPREAAQHDHRRCLTRLPHQQRGRRGDFVGEAGFADLQAAPVEIRRAAQIDRAPASRRHRARRRRCRAATHARNCR